MSLPDLWSPDAMVPKPIVAAPSLAIVVRRAPPPDGPWGANHFMPFPWLLVRYAQGDETMTARGIIADEASRHGMTVAALLGEGRSRNVVAARRAATRRLAATGRTVADIARAMNRDHTTVLNHLGLRRQNPAYADKYRAVRKARRAERRLAREAEGK